MAKKSRFAQILEQEPRRKEFTITMVADTTTLVSTEIATNLGDKQAWEIYGVEWQFEDTDLSAIAHPFTIGQETMVFQVLRGGTSSGQSYTTIKGLNDNAVMYNFYRSFVVGTDTGHLIDQPIRIIDRKTTVQQYLTVIFQTSANALNLTENHSLVGALLYDVVTADASASKQGDVSTI